MKHAYLLFLSELYSPLLTLLRPPLLTQSPAYLHRLRTPFSSSLPLPPQPPASANRGKGSGLSVRAWSLHPEPPVAQTSGWELECLFPFIAEQLTRPTDTRLNNTLNMMKHCKTYILLCCSCWLHSCAFMRAFRACARKRKHTHTHVHSLWWMSVGPGQKGICEQMQTLASVQLQVTAT